MLRIEILQPLSSSENSNSEISSCLHANLATASHHKNGVILTVGRKNADVIFENERSVSRSHCSLRIVKLHPNLREEGNCSTQAQTEDEMRLCRDATDGLAFVLDDLGSKFGTRVSMEKEPHSINIHNTNNSDTDDETDDEGAGVNPTPCATGALTSSQLSAAPILFPNENLVTKTLEKNGSIVLHSLTLRSGTQEGSDKYALVQVGNALFKVTRIRLEFCLSRLQPKEKKELENLGEIIGANVTSTFNCDGITHLVSPDKSSTAKSISAWALNIPTVTSDFIRAHANRKNMKDPLPQVNDYAAPPGLSRIENNAIPSERRKLLEGYKVLSLMWSEGEMMCQCTGATVVPLYRTDNDQKMDLKFWQNDEFWVDLQRQQKKDQLVVVWLDSASKKLTKGRDYLVQLTNKLEKETSEFRIYCINQNCIARAISYGSNLTDVDENTLVPMTTCANSVNGDTSDRIRHGDCEDLNQHEVSVDASLSSFAMDSQPKPTTKKHLATETEMEETTEGKDDGSKNKRSSRSNKESSVIQQRKTRSEEQSGWISSTKSKTTTVEEKGTDIRNSERNNADKSETEMEQNYVDHIQDDEATRKSTLIETEDGWFGAAPQGKQRDRYKRPFAEDIEMDEMKVRTCAETDYCNNLVVRSEEKIARLAKHIQMNRETTINGERVKDFKRFKKNPIIAGAKMHSISQIRLVSVLPKESDRQRELENMQTELEREQLVADALFSGERGTNKRGIQNFFQPTPKSRGRTSTRGRA